jgi:hypothetical protein
MAGVVAAPEDGAGVPVMGTEVSMTEDEAAPVVGP